MVDAHLRINKKAHTQKRPSRGNLLSRKNVGVTNSSLTGCENKAGDYPWPIYRNGPSLLPEPFNRKIISRVPMSSMWKKVMGRRCILWLHKGRAVSIAAVFVIGVFTFTISSPFAFCWRNLKEVNFDGGMRILVNSCDCLQGSEQRAHLACSCVLAGGLNSPKGATGCCKKANTPCALDKLTDAKWVYWMSARPERGGLRVWMRPQGGFCLILWGIFVCFGSKGGNCRFKTQFEQRVGFVWDHTNLFRLKNVHRIWREWVL